jgi:LacI family transcriptional regulator
MAKGRLTIKDVAHIAGVGVGTVSRVLNNHKSVDPTVRAHVREAIRTLNYEPDTRARDLPRGPTSTVAIVVRDRTMKYLVDFVRAVQEVLDDDGYSMTMAFSESKDRELDLLERGWQKRLAGILMTTSGEDDPDLIAARDRFGGPIVFLETEVPGDWGMVNIAHDTAMRATISHLFELGHRRIALVASDVLSSAARRRMHSFREAFCQRGVALRGPVTDWREGSRFWIRRFFGSHAASPSADRSSRRRTRHFVGHSSG